MPRKKLGSQRFRLREVHKKHQTKSGTRKGAFQYFEITGYWPDGRQQKKRFIPSGSSKSAKEIAKRQAIQEMNAWNERAEGIQRENVQYQTTSLFSHQLRDAEMAVEKLDHAGMDSVADFATRYLDLGETVSQKHPEFSVKSAVNWFMTHYHPEAQSIKLSSAIEKYLHAKLGRSEHTVKDIKYRLSKLSSLCGDKCVHEITIDDLEAAMSFSSKPQTPEISTQTKRNNLKVFRGFFNYAVKNRMCEENPAMRIEPPIIPVKAPNVLTLEQSKKIMKSAMMMEDGCMQNYFALTLFLGLRPSEAADLQHENILQDEQEVLVTGGKMRRSHFRRVEFTPAFTNFYDPALPIVPSGFTKKFQRVISAAGIEKWVPDSPRHTFISCLIALENEAHAQKQAGTTWDMLKRYYQNVIISKKDAHSYFSIRPQILGELGIDIEGDQRPRKKVDWPSNERLLAMVSEHSVSEAARQIGVSDQAVHKRLKKINHAAA